MPAHLARRVVSAPASVSGTVIVPMLHVYQLRLLLLPLLVNEKIRNESRAFA